MEWWAWEADSGSTQLSTLMIDIPGDLVWDLACVQQASYLEGGRLMLMLPLYLHINKKSDDDDDDDDDDDSNDDDDDDDNLHLPFTQQILRHISR